MGEKMTIIDVNAAVKGQFHGKDIQILGRFEGELRVSGSFAMGEGSHVEAKVLADKAEVSGDFSGEIVARHLVFLEKANVSGSVDTQTLAVHEGAVINGPVTAGKGARTSLDLTPSAPAEASPEARPAAGEPAPGRVGRGDPEEAPEDGRDDEEAPSAEPSKPEQPNE